MLRLAAETWMTPAWLRGCREVWTSDCWRPGGGWSSDEVAEAFSGIFLQGLLKRPDEESNE